MLEVAVVLLAGICVLEFFCLIFMFNNYKTLSEGMMTYSHSGFTLLQPESRNEMLEKIKEDKLVQETRQKRQDFLDLFKTGECDDKDAAYFGVNADG